MAITTQNKFGKFSISEEAIQIVASKAASDCYGVVDLISRRFSDNIGHIFNKDKKAGKGITVQVNNNQMFIEVYAVFKVGVNIEAVKKSCGDAVKFAVETFSGMTVKRVQVNVVGIRV